MSDLGESRDRSSSELGAAEVCISEAPEQDQHGTRVQTAESCSVEKDESCVSVRCKVQLPSMSTTTSRTAGSVHSNAQHGGGSSTSTIQRMTLADLEAMNAIGNKSKRFKYDEKLTSKKKEAISELRKSRDTCSIEEQEIMVRKAERSNFIDSFHNVLSSLRVIFVFLLTKETYATMILTILCTCYFYFMHRDNPEWDGSGVPFVLLSVAVVIPTMNLISMEYNRRELALSRLGDLRANWLRLYQLHAYMDWDNGRGRKIFETQDPLHWLSHVDRVGDNIMGACDELMRYLTLPSSTNTHNYLTRAGRKRANEILSVGEPLFESVTARRSARFTELAEVIKAAGAAPTEMSRVEQFHRDMQAQYEHLRFIKLYRTPQALRSLARVTTIMMLPLFGPSFAQLALNVESLFFGLMLATVSALILSGLYEAAKVAQDPFTAFVVMDGINVREELDTLFRQLCAIRDQAFKEQSRTYPYEAPSSLCITFATAVEYFNDVADISNHDDPTKHNHPLGPSLSFPARQQQHGRDGKTTESIMEATPNQRNRRKRFGPIR